MLQWFISFNEFAEFTEILLYLGKNSTRRELLYELFAKQWVVLY